ncbi:putative amidoligase enzyme-domain-containing protein [Xylariaceae sp. FL1651]|nr:putative amidoligase enzyme-domain-containing protein [Xylariaceae sp. FL1651]
MSDLRPAKLNPPTMGVEIEFLIATLEVGKKDPHRGVKGLPPVLRIPRFTKLRGQAEQYVRDKVQAVLRNSFGTRPLIHPDPDKSPFSLVNYTNWLVEGDYSVEEDSALYNWVAVEIGSPAEFASPMAFDAITYAISTITTRFRCLINNSCGLHVHVGLGSERLPLEHIRRLASLSWAIEPLLFTLHDPIRRVNTYCSPLREHSHIAKGSKAFAEHDNPKIKPLSRLNGKTIQCYPYLGREVRHGSPPLSVREQNVQTADIEAFLKTRRPGHYEPYLGPSYNTRIFPSPPWANDAAKQVEFRISRAQQGLPSVTTPPTAPARRRNIPRVQLPRHTIRELRTLVMELGHLTTANLNLSYDRNGQLMDDNDTRPDLGVFEGVSQIYSQHASCNIAAQLNSDDPMAINFNNYQCMYLDASDQKTKRTIEFRLAEGSLDGAWIAVWAKICVGLFKFALYATPLRFLQVLESCDQATSGDGTYDVIDLIDDIGLHAEAEIAEKRLMANKDKWHLKFAQN